MDKALVLLLSAFLSLWQGILPPILQQQPSGGSGSVAVVGTSNTGSFGTSFNIALTANVASGDLLAGFCTGDNANSSTAFNWTFSDTQSNSYSFASTTNTTWQQLNATNVLSVGVGYSHITTALVSGTDHVTFAPSVGGHYSCYVVDVPSSFSHTTLDQIAGNNSTFSATQTRASITPSTGSTIDFVVGEANASTFSAYGNVIGLAATGLGNQVNSNSSNLMALEYRILSATTAGTGTYTIAASQSGSMIHVNFK